MNCYDAKASRLIAALLVTIAAAASPLLAVDKKVIVIGFDGMDPHLSERMMDAGELPHVSPLEVGHQIDRDVQCLGVRWC